MPEAPPPPPIAWSAPTSSVPVDPEAPEAAVAALLLPPDRAAGVAADLVGRARRHGAVDDTRTLDLRAGPQHCRLRLEARPWSLQLTPAPGRAGALAALRSEVISLAAAQQRMRHDVRSPVELARQALATHPAAAAADSVEALALERLADAARVAEQVGRAGAAPSPAARLDLALLADLAVALEAEKLCGRGITVTRGVLPVVTDLPGARLHGLVTALRGATLGLARGGHLHVFAHEVGGQVALRVREVG